ncbi:MAG: UDP-glucose/GDP-mannose dehydrogenase family protein [Chloroflexi bacterium]|nr:UDP-glucose/GDP-mannose dehydrogenase family protein [Chloroflexota bacterium]
MKTIAVIGTGYVGLVTATCFADLGNRVIGIDIDEKKIRLLKDGIPSIYEPGLKEMVGRNMLANRLSFTTSYEEGLAEADFVFIAVDTPSGSGGEADLRHVRSAAQGITRVLDHPVIVINRSTVPIGTGDIVADILRSSLKASIDFGVVSNPEFTREGAAIADFLNPDRVVLGSTNREWAESVAQLYLPLRAPIIITDIRTAEMIKYASNAFLATRISFINEIASICERMGADIKEVAVGMGYDKRIGHAFLDAGIGWGGSCFPKDVRALEYMGSVHGCHPQMLRAVMEINRDRRREIVHKLRVLLGGNLNHKTIGILGLAFKPQTDDMREAPSVEIIHLLETEGARIQAYDPEAMKNAESILPGVKLCSDAYDVAEGADALVLVTEWNEFKNLDFAKIRNHLNQPVLVDGRNLYDPQKMHELGFIYSGMGRGNNEK